MNLWQWLPHQDRWEWVTAGPADEKIRRRMLIMHKRRSPGGTQFRWRTDDQGAPKRYRQRKKA